MGVRRMKMWGGEANFSSLGTLQDSACDLLRVSRWAIQRFDSMPGLDGHMDTNARCWGVYSLLYNSKLLK